MPYKDRAVRLAYLKAYREAHIEIRQQQRPFYDMAIHANQRAKKYGVGGRINIDDVRATLGDNPKCFYCGSTKLLGLDHVVPLALGGFNVRGNLVTACRSCNSSKWRGEMPHQWARNANACRRCGTATRPHIAKGLCNACYLHNRKKQLSHAI